MVDIDLSPITVLIIDDSRYARSFVKSAVQSFGIRSILEAADGATGIELARDHTVDLVLVDYDMSPMNGVEFTRLVRQGDMVSAPEVPIVMISGMAEKETVIEARLAGVTEFLVKPVSAESLFRRVRSAMTNPRPFVHAPSYIGPCRRTVARRPASERRRAPPLPKPKPRIDPPPVAETGTPKHVPAPPAANEKTSRKRFKAGDVIFREGDKGDEAYVVLSGRVSIFKDANGEKVVLGELGPNGVFGEMALLDNEPRMASAEAVEDTMCLVIPEPSLKMQVQNTPELVILVLETLLHDIRKLGRELVAARAGLGSRAG
ncbi:MAG: cyclic nucleotide-binding domain-containing protein [Magnetospirillum sp.]|nr:MAG: cyclic nucleotide-binding domain-containing protein [Magnetospirillum sp.]